MIWLYVFSLYVSTLLMVFVIIFSKIMGWSWWQPPMKLRIKFPAFDKFCCWGGLHRCVPICGRGCCWECVRCEAEKAGKLNEHYAIIHTKLKASV